MFYAQFVLSKKGPLAKIWLAAHWERKLTKAHVFETNIDKAVESILEPKVKMALRTTGHLLLGIVRIYSRKAKYLLADCNEAFLKIKMAFRPGVVDLPEEGREANLNAITLPEVFHDFDSALPDFSDMDFPQHLNQSRVEDITLKEDLPASSNAFPTHNGDDEFGDGDFDSIEFAREDTSSRYNAARASSISLKPDDSLRSAGRIDIDAPILDDGFGGEIDANLLDGDLNLFGDGDNLVDLRHVEEADFGGGGADSDGERATPRPSTRTGAEATTTGEQTTLITNGDEAFPLEPMDATPAVGERHPKAKRRRKLIVDEVKAISGEDMKQQLADASDTLTSLDLAPPTKKLMHWKETGGVDKLFVLPAIEIPSKQLCKLFSSNLSPRQRELPRSAGAAEEELVLEEVRGASLVDDASTSVIGADGLPTIAEELDERPPPSVSPYAGGFEPQTPAPDAEKTPTAKTPKSPKRNHPKEKPSPTDAGEESEEEEDEEQNDGEPRWTKRTQAFLNTIQRHLRTEKSVSFKDLTKNKTRKQAAHAFYNVLVLRKWDCIEVKQSEPYEEIQLSAGPAMNTTERG